MNELLAICFLIVEIIEDPKSLDGLTSNCSFSNHVTDSYIIKNGKNIPLQMLVDNDSRVKLRYYKDSDSIKIWHAEIQIKNEICFVGKLCKRYDLIEEQVCKDNFETRYVFAQKSPVLKNVVFSVAENNDSDKSYLRLIIENNKFGEENFKICLVTH
jgi:hypothetical protein